MRIERVVAEYMGIVQRVGGAAGGDAAYTRPPDPVQPGAPGQHASRERQIGKFLLQRGAFGLISRDHERFAAAPAFTPTTTPGRSPGRTSSLGRMLGRVPPFQFPGP